MDNGHQCTLGENQIKNHKKNQDIAKQQQKWVITKSQVQTTIPLYIVPRNEVV